MPAPHRILGKQSLAPLARSPAQPGPGVEALKGCAWPELVDSGKERPAQLETEVGTCEGPAQPEVNVRPRPTLLPPEAGTLAACQATWEPGLTAVTAAPL